LAVIAVHLGHLAVHQYGVVRALTGFAYGLEAILGQVYLVAEFLQHPHGHSLVYRVVLGEQQPTPAGARGGYLAGLAFRGPRLTEAEGRRERLVEL
jgi:hypothetical protein